MEQAISNALGSVEHGIDSLIGASWHRFAELTSWLWSEFKRHADLILTTASYVVGLGFSVEAIRTLVHDLSHHRVVQSAQVKTLERELHGIEEGVRDLQQEIGRGIGHDLRIQVGQLETELGTITSTTIPAIQAAESDAASAISNLYDWAKGKAALLGVGTISAAVATALGVLGLGQLTCPGFLKNLGHRGCGLWNDLESVLGLLADVLIIASICDVLPWLTEGVDTLGIGLVEGIHAAGLSACSGSYPPPPPMPAVNLSPPTVYGPTFSIAAG
jgi:DNA-binding transcriptional MerR regulator